jgi:hypothetical protein
MSLWIGIAIGIGIGVAAMVLIGAGWIAYNIFRTMEDE